MNARSSGTEPAASPVTSLTTEKPLETRVVGFSRSTATVVPSPMVSSVSPELVADPMVQVGVPHSTPSVSAADVSFRSTCGARRQVGRGDRRSSTARSIVRSCQVSPSSVLYCDGEVGGRGRRTPAPGPVTVLCTENVPGSTSVFVTVTTCGVAVEPVTAKGPAGETTAAVRRPAVAVSVTSARVPTGTVTVCPLPAPTPMSKSASSAGSVERLAAEARRVDVRCRTSRPWPASPPLGSIAFSTVNCASAARPASSVWSFSPGPAHRVRQRRRQRRRPSRAASSVPGVARREADLVPRHGAEPGSRVTQFPDVGATKRIV